MIVESHPLPKLITDPTDIQRCAEHFDSRGIDHVCQQKVYKKMLTNEEKTALVLEAIDRIEGTCGTLRSLIQDMSSGKTTTSSRKSNTSRTSNISSSTSQPTKASSTTAASPSAPQKNRGLSAVSLPASELGDTPNVDDANWPLAIEPHLITPADADDSEKQFRAIHVVGIIEQTFGFNLNGSNVLDYGCYEGHVSAEMATKAAKVVGFDIHKSWVDPRLDNLKLTTDPNELISNGPYDYIILYDVLDHLETEDPSEVLKNLRKLLSPGGKIFCRCHPWTAKHGSHLYEQCNRAYIHLALTPDEMAQRSLKLDHNLRLTKPMAAYTGWFQKAGLQLIKKKITSEQVPEYFSDELLERIIKVSWGGKIDKSRALKIMANQFCDYVLGCAE